MPTRSILTGSSHRLSTRRRNDAAIRGRTSLALEDGECDHALKRSRSRLHSRCPGAHLVESSAWLLIVSMIATLDIGKAIDEHGMQVEPEVVYDNSIFRYVSWARRERRGC